MSHAIGLLNNESLIDYPCSQCTVHGNLGRCGALSLTSLASKLVFLQSVHWSMDYALRSCLLIAIVRAKQKPLPLPS